MLKKLCERIRAEKPPVIIGSPECTMLSRLQHLSGGRGTAEQQQERERIQEEGKEHLRFMIGIYRHPMKDGEILRSRTPLNATSWQEEGMQKLNEKDGVIQVRADQCMLGLKTRDKQGNEIPALKPTKFSTNSMHLA